MRRENMFQTCFFCDTDISDVESFVAPFFFVLGALPYVCMVWCGRPAAFMWLCKPRTIEDHVLCHATVVSSTNLLKSQGI